MSKLELNMFLKNNKKRLSSKFTFIYKSAVPFVIILLNVVLLVSVLFIFPDRYWDLYIILVPFCLIVSLISIYPLLRLREVFFDDENGILIGEKGGLLNVPLTDILAVNRFMFYFFRIAYFNKDGTEKNILVMPKIREFLPTFGLGEIESFKLLKDKINKIDGSKCETS